LKQWLWPLSDQSDQFADHRITLVLKKTTTILNVHCSFMQWMKVIYKVLTFFVSPKFGKICHFYTCQLFLRYRREIFILGVLRVLKTIRSFPKIPDEVRSLPKNPEVFRKRPKSQSQYNRKLTPSAFHFINQRSRERYCHLFILHMVFVSYMGLS